MRHVQHRVIVLDGPIPPFHQVPGPVEELYPDRTVIQGLVSAHAGQYLAETSKAS
jgi:hypothetical protein